MIPKIIHICWFSDDKYPFLIKQCFRSWKKRCPDYELRIWDYEMAKSLGIAYVNEALRLKKWAFAADVVRLYALYTYGGVYLDSDIFLKKNIDELMSNNFISAIEFHPKLFNSSTIDSEGNRIKSFGNVPGMGVQAAFLASVPQHYFVKGLLDFYKSRHFINSDGTLDMAIIAPTHYVKYAERYGYKYFDITQKLNDMTFYASCYVAGSITRNDIKAYAIHCCYHSWAKRTMLENIKSFILKEFILLKLLLYNI